MSETVTVKSRKIKSERIEPTVITEYGEVVSSKGNMFVVRLPDHELSASRAFSCLVTPIAGDRVLISRDTGFDQGNVYILAIIKRRVGEDASLDFPGDVELNTKQGKFQINAKEGLRLLTGNVMEVLTPLLQLNASRSELNMENLKANAREVVASFLHSQVYAEKIDTFTDRWVLKAKNSFRWVEELDQLKAGEVIHLIRKVMSMHSQGHTVITAEGDVRVDGDRIHMG
ncbi:MAG: DUF3540 domain-containing protein [SAR324 cluster bacterium]|nr:DUF3540 domain-containing protein [SAR324 cluster bacterium]